MPAYAAQSHPSMSNGSSDVNMDLVRRQALKLCSPTFLKFLKKGSMSKAIGTFWNRIGPRTGPNNCGEWTEDKLALAISAVMNLYLNWLHKKRTKKEAGADVP